jgi:23S rRNA pseudouridine1911/1915/1917 synthase
MNETIPAALAGERVDRVVAMITGLTRSDVTELIASGAVAVNEKTATKPSLRVHEGDRLDVVVPELVEEPVAQPEPEVEVPVVHEDEHVIVVDKPQELVVHPGAGNARGTMVAGLLARYPELAGVGEPERPGIVHRLDKGTSGLLVVARRQDAYESLVEQLSSRSVERRYLTLVWGCPEPATGVVDAPIGRSRRDPTRMTVSATGREARTRYEVRERFTEPIVASLLECKLETGRTHQIRVHLAAIGRPVVGDPRYKGARSSFKTPRMFLHAHTLAFDHPATGERVSFSAPLPADLQGVLDRLSS